MTDALLKKIQASFKQSVHSPHSDFYRKKYGKRASVKNWDDFYALPFTTRDDLFSVEPRKRLFIPLSSANLIRYSSMTGGRNALIIFSALEARHSTRRRAANADLNSAETILLLCGPFRMAGYHELFGKKLRMWTVAGRIHKLDFTARLAKATNTDAILGSPRQAIRLYPHLKKFYDPQRIKALRLGSEPINRLQWESLKRYYPNAALNLNYSSTEAGPIAGFKCPYLMKKFPRRYHFAPDFFYEVVYPELVERVDRISGEPLKENELGLPAEASAKAGELVLTTLGDRALRLVRYRTGDFVQFVSEKGRCPCGRLKKYFELFGPTQYSVITLKSCPSPSQTSPRRKRRLAWDRTNSEGYDFFRDEFEKALLPFSEFLNGNFGIEIRENKNNRTYLMFFLECAKKAPLQLKKRIFDRIFKAKLLFPVGTRNPSNENPVSFAEVCQKKGLARPRVVLTKRLEKKWIEKLYILDTRQQK